MALGILREQLSGSIQMSVLANAGEDIQHFAPVRLRVLYTVRGQDRQSTRARKIDKFTIDAVFAANEMPLKFHEHIFRTERIDEKLGTNLGSACVSRAGFGVAPKQSSADSAPVLEFPSPQKFAMA